MKGLGRHISYIFFCFQLSWNDRRSYTRELMINGGEKFLVNVEYRPSAVRQHQGKLVIKPSGMAVKFSVSINKETFNVVSSVRHHQDKLVIKPSGMAVKFSVSRNIEIPSW